MGVASGISLPVEVVTFRHLRPVVATPGEDADGAGFIVGVWRKAAKQQVLGIGVVIDTQGVHFLRQRIDVVEDVVVIPRRLHGYFVAIVMPGGYPF